MICANDRCEFKNKCECIDKWCFVEKDKPLKNINFNNIEKLFKGISIFVDDKEIASGFIGEVLEKVIDYADRPVKSCNNYFDMLVIRL